MFEGKTHFMITEYMDNGIRHEIDLPAYTELSILFSHRL